LIPYRLAYKPSV